MAAPKQEPIIDIQKKTLDAAMHLAQITMENGQRIAEVQVETARSIFEDTINGLRSMAEAKDSRAAMEVRNELTQRCGEHVMAGTLKVADLATSASTEVGRMIAQQMASGSASLVDMMSRVVQSMPVTGAEGMNIFQGSLDSTRSAMEQMSKAGQEALSSLTNITTRAAGAATKTATAIVEPFTPRVAPVETVESPAAASGGKRVKHE